MWKQRRFLFNKDRPSRLGKSLHPRAKVTDPQDIMALQSAFQWKYTRFLLLAVALATLLAGGPCLYFLNSNYQIFLSLAYDVTPDIVSNLERERSILNGFLLATSTGAIAFSIFVGLRMTSRIVGPVAVIDRHLHRLMRGEWSSPLVRTRQADEFQDLVRSYNYFYSSLQKQVAYDLKRLKALPINPAQHEAHSAWIQMIEEKEHQLGLDSGPANQTRSNVDKSMVSAPNAEDDAPSRARPHAS